jgi:hypothetical protein
VNTAQGVQAGLGTLDLAALQLVLVGDDFSGTVDLALRLEGFLQRVHDAVDRDVAAEEVDFCRAESDHESQLATTSRVGRIIGHCGRLRWRRHWPRDAGAYGRGARGIVARL